MPPPELASSSIDGSRAADQRARTPGGPRRRSDGHHRPRLRHTRGSARARSFSARRGRRSTGTTSPARRSNAGRSRSSSSVRSTSTCRSCSWSPRERRWRRPRTSSSAGRQRGWVVAGVTGTSGKTTTTFLLHSIFEAAGMKPGPHRDDRVAGRRRVAAGRADDAGGDRPPAHASARCSTPATAAS